jgi:hypothetical protein
LCERIECPGLSIDDENESNFSRRSTTPDQADIETVLEDIVTLKSTILHVGIGNSRFAERFAPQSRHIVGITVSPCEEAVAESKFIENYVVYRLSKYSRDLATRIIDKCDFIVDNNLTSFACCKYHVFTMMETYANLLAPNGKILTHQRGMSYVYEKADPCWAMNFEDLLDLGRKFQLRASKITNLVYALSISNNNE